jgi:hypothetical protein
VCIRLVIGDIVWDSSLSSAGSSALYRSEDCSTHMGSIVGFSVSLPSIRSHSRAEVSTRCMQYGNSPFLSVGRSRHRLVCLSKRTLALTPRMDVTAQGTAEPSQKQFESLPPRTLVCTSLTSSTVDGQLAEVCRLSGQSSSLNPFTFRSFA